MLRKVLFWCHLTAGTTAGVVILTMCVTGVLLMYERQVIAWADRGFRSSPGSGGTARLSPEALLKKLPQAATLTIKRESTAPAEASVAGRIVYMDVYTGQIVGEGDKAIRTFFRAVTDWHRWLAMQDSNRPVGRAITGAANLIFLFIVLSGMYLWLPRHWSWQNARAVLLFRGGLRGKARDFNWHNVIGIWCALPLFFIVLGALVISYPWATNLLYRLTGSELPMPPSALSTTRNPGIAGLDEAWSQAERRVPGWQTISARIPAPNVELTIAESHRGRPDKRYALTIDRTTGAVLRYESFESYNTGRRLRLWLRFVHTGEALGLAGQTLAGLVSAGGAVLVWTGLSLAWRRWGAWRARTRNRTA